jgi:hypothetical protein
MAREDVEQLSALVMGLRDGAQNIVDACNVFLRYLESSSLGSPQDPAVWDELEWEDRENDATHHKYQMLRIDEDLERHRQLRLLIKNRKGSLYLGQYRYSLGTDDKVIFRSLIKGDSAK